MSNALMEQFGLPAGRYAAQVDGFELVKPRRAKQHELSLRAKVERNGKSVIETRTMGNGDPYALSPSLRRGLRAMAKRLGVQDRGPVEEIVAAIRALEGERVTAHVRPSRFGLLITLSRNGATPEPVTEEPLDTLAPEPDYRERTREAQGAHEMLMTGLNHSHRGLAVAAHGCWLLRKGEGWVALGYDSVGAYLASPEVSLSRTQFYALADIWEQYVEVGKVDDRRLCSPSKLEVPLAALKAGDVTAEEALADAEALGLRDLREKYRGDDEDDPQESGRPDKVAFPFACRSCGVIAESADDVDADGIVYMGHRWPGGWTEEQVVAAYEAGRAVR